MTNSIYLQLTPRDPLIFRDGRPFGNGVRMKGMAWLMPSVVAGSLRSLLGKQAGADWSAIRADLQNIHSSAAFPLINNTLYLPAPLDISHTSAGTQPLSLSAGLSAGEGWLASRHTDDYRTTLQLLLPPNSKKPLQGPPWWRADVLAAWLAGEVVSIAENKPDENKPDEAPRFWQGAQEDLRTHTAIIDASGTAEEGRLFQTVGRDFSRLHGDAVRLAVRVSDPGQYAEALRELDTLHPLGGERRLAHWQSTPCAGWTCPSTPEKKPKTPEEKQLKDAKKDDIVRLYLASPADFGTWLPDWLDRKTLQGTPPGCKGLKLQLVAARVERWQALSGWDYEKRAPKQLRRLVPAGSVYYLRIVEGAGEILAQRWLQPVQERHTTTQGFGLGAWGVFHQKSGV